MKHIVKTHFIPVDDKGKIALDWAVPESGPGKQTAVFVHGFGSNRQGDKASYFAEKFCGKGWNFLSFDMRGHGDSSGDMRELTLTRCKADLGAALDWLPDGLDLPVLIGSSMGGAVSAWYQLRNPGKVGGIVMIAPSLSFPGSFAASLAPELQEQWERQGFLRFQNDWMDVEVGFVLIEDSRGYEVERIFREYSVPTLIFHGQQDDSVNWRESLDFLEKCRYPVLDLLLIKNGDHRLTEYKAYMFQTMFAWCEEHFSGA